MARRNDHTREELTELTLQTLDQFLTAHSYRELSLRKLASLIGYVPSTLVNVFGSYNLLLLHGIARTLDKLSQLALTASQQHSDNPKQALLAIAHCYHDFAKAHPNHWQLIFEHSMQGDELPQWQSQRIETMMTLLETLLHALSPQRSDQEVLEASRVLWSGVHGITLLSVDDKFFTSSPVNGEHLIDNLIEQYLQNWSL